MKAFPENTKFKKPWRSYQERVLSDIKEKMKDGHLHIIAPPGSGKTVLGLEVMRRINSPTLILAPTLAIRDQWVERFCDLFLDKDEDTSWISKDINNPKFLTVSTYQSLHSAMSGKPEEDDTKEPLDDDSETEETPSNVKGDNHADKLIKSLIKIGVKTFVVDEAHHLRSEWWKSLISLKEGLKNPIIVALTATPPYDSTPLEWERYTTLCGSIDAEIFVPELIKSKDLCPHQDYIYFSLPSNDEKREIITFRSEVKTFTDEILQDDEFKSALVNHPCIVDPISNIEVILENPEYYSSIIIFLKKTGNKGYEKILEIMGTQDKRMPSLNLEWLEILLTNCIYKDSTGFAGYENALKRIRLKLSKIGAIERKKVNLVTTIAIKKLLLSSITKLGSIEKIVNIESCALKKRLRMVILTDYIRLEEMPKDSSDIKFLSKIGVVPIFELLRRANNTNIKLGVLSGGLIIVPESSCDALFRMADKKGISHDKLALKPLNHDEAYCMLEIKGQDVQGTQIVTELFTQGEITVLVGTKSLLGEGWDAPCINSLIIASFVGSFMLSNQMRGRAIRVWPYDNNKTANIWHLVCIEEGQESGNYDLELLSRRFKSFVGVSSDGLGIESGIGRFSLPELPYTIKDIDDLNRKTIVEAIDRDSLASRWKSAVSDESSFMHEELRTDKDFLPIKFIMTNTIKAVVWEGISIVAMVFSFLSRSNVRVRNIKSFLYLILGASVISAVLALPKFIKAAWLYIKYGPAEAAMKQIGEALLKSLIYSKDIETDIENLRVRVETGETAFVLCSLVGGTTYEASVFINALEEILGPINNPRYILTRKSMMGKIKRKDYHAVPSLLGGKEKNASYFHSMWKKNLGSSELIYTRSVEGRKLLLKARVNSLSSEFVKRSERVSCYK